MNEYLELGENAHLTILSSIRRATKIQEGGLLKAVIGEDSLFMIRLPNSDR